ncbi:MAG: peptidase [Segetibacter sp.]|nr:peptidase [Segetibacter sp.]
MTRYISLFAILTFVSLTVYSQTELPIPKNLQATYEKGTRSADGRPGPKYWQNKADYDISVNYDPATRILRGVMVVTYTNNSPDSLKELWLKLYPNLYEKGAPRGSRIAPEDVNEGLHIGGITIQSQKSTPVVSTLDNTNMKVLIPALATKETITLKINYDYVLNKGSHIRTGQIDSNSAFIAYFFPRIAVYDDIDGWNKNPYLGTQEFYNDFCNFKVAISVPDKFIVWSTGDLKNCSQVFTEKYCTRIQQAERSDSITTIISEADLAAGNITAGSLLNVWRFEADNVPDFAFATSDHYIWQSASVMVDSTTKRRTRVDAAFNPIHKDFFEVAHYNRETVKHMSFAFPKWPFPYSHETVFDGLDQMEYPMMVNDNPVETKFDAITLTDHEVFHTMFPFYMGINETKYAWMDEGWATIGEWLVSPMIDTSIVDDYGMAGYEKAAGTEIDVPITTLSTFLNSTSNFINSYPKPALGYLYVKDFLGDKLFFKALHFYIAQWNGKHPMPYDFFNSMNTGSGKNLNWFWKRWFFDDGVPDLAIKEAKQRGRRLRVKVESIGNKPVPVNLTIVYEDGTKTNAHRSIAVWENTNSISINIPVTKKIVTITLGSTYTADTNKADNQWTMK